MEKIPAIEIMNAADFLKKDLNDIFNIKLEIVKDEISEADKKSPYIIIGEKSKYPAPAELCKKAELEIPANDEGYSLYVDDMV